MGRKSIQQALEDAAKQPELTFSEKVEKFYDIHSRLNALKKVDDPLNKEIKQHLLDNKLPTFISDGGYTATVRKQEKPSASPEKMVRKLRALGFEEAIETVEVPNQKVIEELIYAGRLSAAELADCVDVKEVFVLTVKKPK